MTCSLCLTDYSEEPDHDGGSAECRLLRYHKAFALTTMKEMDKDTWCADPDYATDLAALKVTNEEKIFFIKQMLAAFPGSPVTCTPPLLYADLPLDLTCEEGLAAVSGDGDVD